jgi:hypothetical protein
MIELLRMRNGTDDPATDFCVVVDPSRHKAIRDDVLRWAQSDENCGGFFRMNLHPPQADDPEYRILYMFDKAENAVDMRVRFG